MEGVQNALQQEQARTVVWFMEKTFSCQDCQAEQWCQLHLHSQQVVFTDCNQRVVLQGPHRVTPLCTRLRLQLCCITAVVMYWGMELGQANT